MKMDNLKERNFTSGEGALTSFLSALVGIAAFFAMESVVGNGQGYSDIAQILIKYGIPVSLTIATWLLIYAYISKVK